MVEYIPAKGEIIWIDFFPQKGREIEKRRPALVVTPLYQNKHTKLVTVFPITSTIRNIELEVIIDKKPLIFGAVLPFQIKSLDFSSRKATLITSVSDDIVEEVIKKFLTFLEMDSNY